MKKFLSAFFLLLSATLAFAQDGTNHSMPVFGGPGFVGFREAGPCAASQALVWAGGVGADPSCTTVITGTLPPPQATFDTLCSTNNTTFYRSAGVWTCLTGTSGGIPYFNSATTFTSSGVLTANVPVIGGGAGVAPSSGTRSGNTTAFVTTTGAQTSGNCVSIDANGNHIASGGSCGSILTINVQRFTASGTYTPTANTRYVLFECIGGGGSGAGGTGVNPGFLVGGGGGSGGYSKAFASAATIGASQVVTIGPGGTAPAAGNNAGGAGTDTSVGALCIGKGGAGGNFTSVAQNGAGGAGGVAGTGNAENPAGNPGTSGFTANTNAVQILAGMGASSRLGPGAAAVTQSGAGSTTTGAAALANSGGGGSGGNMNNTTNTIAGGNGGSGLVLATEFIQ